MIDQLSDLIFIVGFPMALLFFVLAARPVFDMLRLLQQSYEANRIRWIHLAREVARVNKLLEEVRNELQRRP